MVNFNRVFVVGNLTKDPELRYTPSGSAVVTLRVAVNTPFKDKAGQLQKDTCFINAIAWGPIAEACNQYLAKGRSVFVEGRLQSRSWQDSEGKNRTTIEIRAIKVQFMPGKGPGPGPEARSAEGAEEPEEITNFYNNADKAVSDGAGDGGVVDII